MSHFWLFLMMLPVLAVVSYFWVRGIDYMHKNHPNYKGEDFLSWDEDEENKNHTEPEF
jgi:hypothetical protein